MDLLEIIELACAMTGRDADKIETASDEIALEETLAQRFNIDFNDLVKIAEKLLPLCTQGTSPLTGNNYRGFAKDGAWLAKVHA